MEFLGGKLPISVSRGGVEVGLGYEGRSRWCKHFFFFLESIRLISLRLCGAPVPSP